MNVNNLNTALKVFTVDAAASVLPADLPPLLNTTGGYVVIPYNGIYLIQTDFYFTYQKTSTCYTYPACSSTMGPSHPYVYYTHTLTSSSGAVLDTVNGRGESLRAWITYITAGSRISTEFETAFLINNGYTVPSSYPFLRKSRITIRRIFTDDR